jgi:hypothetical protein
MLFPRGARWYFAALLLVVLDSIVKNLVLTGKFQSPVDLAGHVVFGSLCLVGISTRREPVHKALAILALLVFTSYIALLFVPLPD